MRWWDLPEVYSIEKDLYSTTPWSPRTFWSELALVPVTREYFIARSSSITGAIVAYAGVALSGKQADIQTLAVTRSEQRQGLGQFLLAHLLEVAVARGAIDVFLDVGNTNLSAISLYLKNGFVEINRRQGCYRGYEETIVMRKQLSAPNDNET